MKHIFLLAVLTLFLFNCNNVTSKPDIIFKTDNSIRKQSVQKDSLISKTQYLKDFLKEPIKLHEFKKKYGGSNSGQYYSNDYFYKPDKIGFYYRYMLFSWLIFDKNPMCYFDGKVMGESGLFKAFQIYVYHFGNSGSFDFYDKNEILIGFRSAGIHEALGKANLVGKTLPEIEELFGNDYFDMDDIKIYQHNKRVLSLKLTSSKVEWIKYYHHSVNIEKENIPKHLLKFEELL